VSHLAARSLCNHRSVAQAQRLTSKSSNVTFRVVLEAILLDVADIDDGVIEVEDRKPKHRPSGRFTKGQPFTRMGFSRPSTWHRTCGTKPARTLPAKRRSRPS
jgi:hypothetical protein